MSDWDQDFLVLPGATVQYELENGSDIRVQSTSDVRIYCKVEPNDPTDTYLEQVNIPGFGQATITSTYFIGEVLADNIGEPEIFLSVGLSPLKKDG